MEGIKDISSFLLFVTSLLIFPYSDLSFNALQSLENQDFGNFTELKRLDLSSNQLQEIDKITVGPGLSSLERLKLANNSIGHIYAGAFAGLPSLKQL